MACACVKMCEYIEESRHVLLQILRLSTVIGLGLRDARFYTLNYKNAHIFHAECAIFAFDIFLVVKK